MHLCQRVMKVYRQPVSSAPAVYPFAGLIADPLPGRAAGKPRGVGLTMVMDKGLGLAETADLLQVAAAWVDFWKLPFGTSALYPQDILAAKIDLVRSAGVVVYPGGTFFEVAISQDQDHAFLQRCRGLGFTAIEVSDGTLEISPARRRQAIAAAAAAGFTVLAEVGKKAPGSRLNLAGLAAQLEGDLAAGASYLNLEGREAGRGVGIYDDDGRIIAGELDAVLQAAPDATRLIWEAPLKSQQQALIARFGPNVNLGNIPPDEILALETLRRGLRGDTFALALANAGSPSPGGAGEKGGGGGRPPSFNSQSRDG